MIEIERKFLVHSELIPDLNSFEKLDLKQGYLQKREDCTVRVRLSNENAFLTIKGKSTNFSRQEFEYAIPHHEAHDMLGLCGDAVVEKKRYLIPDAGKTWELDIFSGKLKGLILAEIELQSENEKVNLPLWISEEVSLDHRYFNSSLSQLSLEDAQKLIAQQIAF